MVLLSKYAQHAVRVHFVSILLVLVGCGQDQIRSESAEINYSTIEWTDLMPKEDLEALMNPPEFLMDIIDGSAEDVIENNMQSTLDEPPQSAYERALVSANVVPEYDQQNVRLPGFIVPLHFNDDLILTEFFLVPYFGACLHTPPPPPNQIVYITMEEGFELESLQLPFWVSGKLTIEDEINDLAHAAYSLSADDIVPYH
ncbi:MAG: DUF3299 domain-containing protein [Pseudomonadota bacterium]